MKKKSILIIVASVIVVAVLAVVLLATLGGSSSAGSGNGGGSAGPVRPDDGAHLPGGKNDSDGGSSDVNGGGGSVKSFSPSLTADIVVDEISYRDRRYDHNSGEYITLDDNVVYYLAKASNESEGGLPSFYIKYTVNYTLKNADDTSDNKITLSESFDVFYYNDVTSNYVTVETDKNGVSFTLDTLYFQMYSATVTLAVPGNFYSLVSACDLTDSEENQAMDTIRDGCNIFGTSNQPDWIKINGTKYTTDKFIYLTEPLDGGTVNVDFGKLYSEDEVPSAYRGISKIVLDYDKSPDAVSESFKSLFASAKTITLTYDDLLEKEETDLPDVGDEDERPEYQRRNFILDKETLKFKKTIGYQSFTFVFDLATFYGQYYSSHELQATVPEVREKYTFKSNSSISLQATVFNKTVDVSATYTEIDNTDGSVTSGYKINWETDKLPLFFASKLTSTEYITCYLYSNKISLIQPSYITPNSATLTFEDVNVNDYLTKGLTDFSLTLSYGEDKYTATYQELLQYAKDGSLFYAQDVIDDIRESEGFTFDDDNDKLSIGIFENWHEASFDTPISIRCSLRLFNSSYNIDFKIKITPYLESIVITDSSSVAKEYWQGDSLSIETGATVSLRWMVELYETTERKEETVPLTAAEISGFSTDTEGQYVYAVVYNGKVYVQDEDLFTYTVKKNSVVSIEVKEGSFKGLYVKHEDFTVTDSKLKVTYENGSEKEADIDVSMISGYDKEKSGEQQITITYKEGVTYYTVTVKEVKSLTFYEQPNNKFCINQSPSEWYVKVQFAGDADDYDVNVLSEEQVKQLIDTQNKTGVNGRTAYYTYGGKQLELKYYVFDAVYLYYTISGTEITIDNMSFDTPEEGATYYLLDDCVNIEITETIDGVAVTGIAKGAFYNQSGVESLKLPSTITKIGDYAFADCVSLKTVNIPYGATVGEKIFENCQKLQDLTIAGDGATAQVLYLYFGKTSTKNPKITIPENLTVRFSEGTETLKDEMFSSLSNNVKKVVFPSTQTSLGTQSEITFVEAFESSSEVVKVTDGVLFTESGKNLYYYPMTLQNKTLTLGTEVTSIGIVKNNSYLEEVTINGNLTSLSEGAFENCTALTKATFNGSLSVIPDRAFQDCEKLSSFKFPSNLTKIGSAFSHVAIETVRIPDTVTSIDTQAFYWAKVKKLYIPFGATASLKGTMGYSSYLYLEELVYDGSVPLSQLTVYREGAGIYPSTLKTIYLTETICENFTNGTTYSKAIYLSSKITSVPKITSIGTKLTMYYEGSSKPSSSDLNVTLSKKSYAHWWE